MANSLLTIDMITRESLRVLKNNLVFAKSVNRQYDDSFGKEGAKIGSTMRLRKPPKYTVSTGATISIQDATESSVTLSLDQRKHVAMAFTTQDLSLSIDDFSKRFISPAIVPIANQIDYDGLQLYKDVYNSVGVAGTANTDLSKYLDAHALMSNSGCPIDPRSAVIGAIGQAKLVNGLTGLFQSAEKIAEQYEKGVMGIAGGFTFKMDQNVASHTGGQLGGTPLMNGATASGATSIVTDGWTAAAANRVKQGDVFTIAGVFAVNPVSKQSTGALQQFVVTADTSSDGAGAATIPVSPSIISSGAFQTVNALPADNAALTFVNAASAVGSQGLLFHPDAFALGMAPLQLPNAGAKGMNVADPDSGLSIRFVEQYDITNDRNIYRLDVLYGWKTLYPELAARVQGT
jgi:P22 coat protein - gene protein 5